MRNWWLNILFCLFALPAMGQISAYRYWFNNQFNLAVTQSGSFGNPFHLQSQITINQLPAGLHVFNIHFKNDTAWSGVSSDFFYKTETNGTGNAAYEYWFDNDFANKIDNAISPSADFSLVSDIQVSTLSAGLHTIHFRFRPTGGEWSSVNSSFFYKTSTISSSTAEYQYWFDNNYDESVTQSTSNQTNLHLLSDLPVGSLPDGLHVLHMRFKPTGSEWSSVTSDFFFKGASMGDGTITDFRYWFNNSSTSSKTLSIGNATEFVADIDVEGLGLGPNYFNAQFRDDKGRWTSIETDSFHVGPITVKNHLFPTITLSGASFNLGQTVVIKGTQFTKNGQVLLRINPATSDESLVDTKIIADNYGNIHHEYPLILPLIKGDYVVVCTDVSAGRNTDARRFYINGLIPDQDFLVIQSPSSGLKVDLNKPMVVAWRDKADYGILSPGTSKLTVRYRIEVQKDNGSWQQAEEKGFTALKDQLSNFSTTYIPQSSGAYKFRVTNLDAPGRTAISGTVNAAATAGGIDVQYVWDHTVPNRLTRVAPIGVAADGTSRIYIKVGKTAGNTKSIFSVEVYLKDEDDIYKTGDRIGRVMRARGISGYGLEANDAKETSVVTTTSSDAEGNFWFWYVAPDDFVRDFEDEYEGSRKVIAHINVKYADNSNEPTIKKEIEIVRPPLMFVHGYAGLPSAWDDFKFTYPNSPIPGLTINQRFIQEYGENKIFKVVRPVTIYPDASYHVNAKRLLDINPQTNTFKNNVGPDAFQGLLKEMHNQKYASNKVDYVAHSMGGAAGRAAISAFDSYYRTSLEGNYLYKNYKMGFINKFITIQTPHNGSPLPNLLNSVDKFYRPHLYNLIHAYDPLIASSSYEYTGDGFLGFPLFEITPVIRDMRFTQGYNFPTTYVKNHLIGTQTFNTIIQGDNLVEKSLSAFKNVAAATGYYLLLNSLPKPFNKLYDLEVYLSLNSNEIPFFPNSDFVVGKSSQLANKSGTTDPSISRFFGPNYWHMASRSNIDIGNRVFGLLNGSINSPVFSDLIQDNPHSPQEMAPDNMETLSEEEDSIIYRFDTSKIKIKLPFSGSHVFYDSIINVEVDLKDTSSLIQTEILFQGVLYNSESKIQFQTFKVEVNPSMPGRTKVYAMASYDSGAYMLKYIDSIDLIINMEGTILEFVVDPGSKRLLPNSKSFLPRLFAKQSNQISYISNQDTGLNFTISDTNVVTIDDYGFIHAKDTGTTQVVYHYKGLKDTLFLMLDTLDYSAVSFQPENTSPCPGSNLIFVAKGFGNCTYQWQVNKGGGYENLINGIIYSGATNDTLKLNSPPSEWSGYRYRCMIINNYGTTETLPALLRYSNTWLGVSGNNWETESNWSCGKLPDEFTDVIIPQSANNPNINGNTACRSLTIAPNATITVKPGINLLINGKQYE